MVNLSFGVAFVEWIVFGLRVEFFFFLLRFEVCGRRTMKDIEIYEHGDE